MVAFVIVVVRVVVRRDVGEAKMVGFAIESGPRSNNVDAGRVFF